MAFHLNLAQVRTRRLRQLARDHDALLVDAQAGEDAVIRADCRGKSALFQHRDQKMGVHRGVHPPDGDQVAQFFARQVQGRFGIGVFHASPLVRMLYNSHNRKLALVSAHLQQTLAKRPKDTTAPVALWRMPRSTLLSALGVWYSQCSLAGTAAMGIHMGLAIGTCLSMPAALFNPLSGTI